MKRGLAEWRQQEGDSGNLCSLCAIRKVAWLLSPRVLLEQLQNLRRLLRGKLLPLDARLRQLLAVTNVRIGVRLITVGLARTVVRAEHESGMVLRQRGSFTDHESGPSFESRSALP